MKKSTPFRCQICGQGYDDIQSKLDCEDVGTNNAIPIGSQAFWRVQDRLMLVAIQKAEWTRVTHKVTEYDIVAIELDQFPLIHDIPAESITESTPVGP